MNDPLLTLLVVALIGAGVIALVLSFRLGAVRRTIDAQAQALAMQRVQEWRAAELEEVRRECDALAQQAAQNALERWKDAHEQSIRQDAIDRSRAVIAGKVTEHLVPYLPEFRFNPKDARFVGSPVDIVVFDGLDDGAEDVSIVFVEIKTGSSALSARERRIREAIRAGRVGWEEVRVTLPKAVNGPARALPPRSGR
jgi:predicted Holliday junction resolvase-like endonuclease